MRRLAPTRVAALAVAFLLPTNAGGAVPPSLSEIAETAPSRELEADFAAEKRAGAMRAAALSFAVGRGGISGRAG